MLKNILIIVTVIIVIFILVVATKPDEFRVARSTTITAPPSSVFAQVNDFHNWQHWSPWAKLDANAQTNYEGPSSGIGAVFRWAGNEQVGEGSNTIIESRPNELVKIKLEFIKPFPGISTAEFAFQPQGSQTLVTWSMYGKNNFIAKAVSLFMDCDKMVGGQFEQGLASLKSFVEGSAQE